MTAATSVVPGRRKTPEMRTPSTLVIALAALLAAVPASGQDTAATAAPDSVAVAPVVIDGEVLFSLRGVSAFPAERRAAELAGRIRALADGGLATSALTLEERPGETVIVAAGRPVLRVHDEDAAVEEVARQALAEAYRNRIAQAIDAYRTARQPARLWRHALQALLATIALVGAAFACLQAIRWLRRRLERRFQSRVRDVHIQSFQIVRAEQLWRGVRGIVRFVCFRPISAIS